MPGNPGPGWRPRESSRPVGLVSMAGPGALAAATKPLWPRFHDHVERRLGSAPHAREAALENDLAQSGLAGLRAERGADLLRQRRWHANHGRCRVVQTPHRIEILVETIAGHRLADHPGSVVLQGLAYVGGGARGVTHVVQAIEARHEIEVLAGIILGEAHLEARVVR